MNLAIDLMLITKITSNWIVDLSVKCKAIKLLKDKVRQNLDDLGYGNEFFRYNTKGTIPERNN